MCFLPQNLAIWVFGLQPPLGGLAVLPSGFTITERQLGKINEKNACIFGKKRV